MEFPPEIRGFVFFEVVQRDNQQKTCSRSENQSVSSIFSKPIEFDGPKTQKAWLVYDFIHVHKVDPYQLLMGVILPLRLRLFHPSYAILPGWNDNLQVPTLDLPGMMSPKVLADDRETRLGLGWGGGAAPVCLVKMFFWYFFVLRMAWLYNIMYTYFICVKLQYNLKLMLLFSRIIPTAEISTCKNGGIYILTTFLLMFWSSNYSVFHSIKRPTQKLSIFLPHLKDSGFTYLRLIDSQTWCANSNAAWKTLHPYRYVVCT